MSGVWIVWYGYVLSSVCGECLVCRLFGMVTFCTVCVRVSGMWTVRCGYGLSSLCGECLSCGLIGMAAFCTEWVRVSGVWNVVVATVCAVCVGSVWCIDRFVWLRSVQICGACLV